MLTTCQHGNGSRFLTEANKVNEENTLRPLPEVDVNDVIDGGHL
jgi:hypothetical protein